MKKLKLNLKEIGIPENLVFNISENDEGLSKELWERGFRELLNSYYNYNLVDKGNLVLDVGANLGYFTLLCKNAKKIICVEPIPNAIPILKKNIEDNGLKDKTEVINAAVSKKEDYLNLEINEKLNWSRIVGKSNEKTVKIRSYPLRELVDRYNTNFIRMDCEGYEYEILMGKIPKQVNKIAMEFHTDVLGDKKSVEFLDYLKKEGFKVRYLIQNIPRKEKFFHKMNAHKITGIVRKDISIGFAKKIIFGRVRDLVYLYRLITKKQGSPMVYLGLERKND